MRLEKLKRNVLITITKLEKKTDTRKKSRKQVEISAISV